MNKTVLPSVLAALLFAASPALAASIALVAPEDGAAYDTHSPCVKEFYANFEKRGVKPARPPLTEEEQRKKAEAEAKGQRWHDYFDFYMFNDYTKDLNERNGEEEKTWKPFEWKTDYNPEETWVEFSETPDFARPVVEKVERKWDRAMRPRYLKLGTKYWWRVRAKDADGAETLSNVATFTTADVPPRMIGPPSWNTRDLGGGTNVFGAKIRQGLLYRSPAPPCNWTDERLRDYYIGKLGIVMELDTRGTNEVNELRTKWNEGNLDEIVKFHVYVPTEDYHLYHSRTKECMPKLFAYLADRGNYPIITHCSAGSDRTGTFCALIDGVLGRDDRYIYDDYESPSFSQWHPRFRYARKASGMFAALDPTSPRHEKEGPDLTGANMRENAEMFLLSIGVKKEHIDAFREIMLEPQP